MSQELFNKWTNGDERAFADLYRAYYMQILSFASALLGNFSAAEDLAQETFLKLHQNRRQFQQTGIANGRALLYTIVRRLAYQHTAYQKRWEKLASQENEILNAVTGTSNTSPEDLFAAAEIGIHIQQAIDDLPEPQREVILLRHREHLSYEEISEILKCSENQLKARLHYARKNLRAKLKKWNILPQT